MAQSTRPQPTSVLVPIQYATCMTSVIAEPGDKLLLFNNFCIGVMSGSGLQPTPIPELPELPKLPKLLPSPKPKSKLKSKPRGGDHRSATITTIVQERKNVVLKVLAEHGPLRAAALCKAANIKKSQLTIAVKHLDAEHLLVISQVQGTGHKRLYQIRKDATP